MDDVPEIRDEDIITEVDTLDEPFRSILPPPDPERRRPTRPYSRAELLDLTQQCRRNATLRAMPAVTISG